MRRQAFLLLCLCLTSNKQIRSYGDRVMAYSLIPQTVKAVDQTCDPWYIMQVVYPLHHGGSTSMFAVGGVSDIKHTFL